MAKKRGWWKLEITNNNFNEITDTDREYIAKLIKEGFTSGEICKDEEE